MSIITVKHLFLLLQLLLLVHNALFKELKLTRCAHPCEKDTEDKILTCEHRDCTQLPQADEINNIDDVYYSEELHFSHNKLINITKMEKYYNLKTLDVSNNHISYIEEEAFYNMYYLRKLNLAENLFTEVQLEQFKGLTSLKELHLNGNQLGFIGDNVFFSPMRAIETLYLSDNTITDIAHNAFTDLPDLKYLHLDHNLISKIEPEHLAGLTDLEALYLQNNLIKRLQRRSFYDCTSLNDLELRNNWIADIETGAFEGLAKLKSLHLSVNQLTQITQGMFDGLDSLQDLYLDRNPITSIQPGSLPLSLYKLSLQHMPKLERIQNGTLTDMEHLDVFELTHSKKMAQIEEGAFSGPESKIRALNLYNNSLLTLSEQLLNWTIVQQPVLAENDWVCDCNLAWIKHSEELSEDDRAQVKCHHPYHLRGRSIVEVDFEQFQCSFYNTHRHDIEVALIFFTTVLFLSLSGILIYKFRHSLMPCCFIVPGKYRSHYNAVTSEDDDPSIQVKFGESTGLSRKGGEKERIIPGPTSV